MEQSKRTEVYKKTNERIKQSEQNMKLKIKTMNGSVYDIIGNIKKPIRMMQGLIEQKTEVPVHLQRLLFKGIMLEPNRLLEEYHIEDGSCILLVANKIPSQVSQQSSMKPSQRVRVNRYTQNHNKYKKHRLLQQRINGFQIRKAQSLQTLQQNKHTINQLLGCLNLNFLNDTPFHLQNRKLEIGEWVDIQDGSGEWLEGQVVDIYGDYVSLSFNGWSNDHNQWVSSKSTRIMPFRSHTVQMEKCKYLSPFPTHSRALEGIGNKNFQPNIQNFMSEVTVTIETLSKLMKQLQFNEEIQGSMQSESPLKCNYNHQVGSQVIKNIDELGQRQIQKFRQEIEQIQKKQSRQPLNDNLSNKCEDDMSNKCDNDDISNKSFKSKRSEGLVDTASMKSLIIEESSRRKQNKVFYDHTEIQSVRSMKPKHQIRRHYVYNQENILQEEDSQYNEQHEDYVSMGKKQWKTRMHASQLAPLLDRMGRLLIDLAPHVAMRGNTDQNNPNLNQNMSTFTNQGSLESRLAAFSQQQVSEGIQNRAVNCQFQIPVMLNPLQIARLNRLLEEENRLNTLRD